MDVLPSCSLTKDDNDVLAPGEQRDPLLLEGNDRDDAEGPVANPLPQEKSECSEAEVVTHVKVSDSDTVDPGLPLGKMELPSSLMMMQDKVDVSSERDVFCIPQAAAEAKFCSTEENQMDDTGESNPLEAEISNQIEASDVATVNSQKLSLRNIDVSPSSLMEENKIEVSSDQGPEVSLAGEGSCNAMDGPSTYSLRESNPSEAEIGNKIEASDVAMVNSQKLSLRNIDVPPSSLMEENKIEVSSDQGPEVSLAGEGSCTDATDGPSTNSLVLVEEVKGLSEEGVDGSTARVQVPETASLGGVSSLENEHVECLSVKDLAGNSESDHTAQEHHPPPPVPAAEVSSAEGITACSEIQESKVSEISDERNIVQDS